MDYTGWLKVIKVLKSGEEKEGEREDFLKVSFYKDLFIFIFWLWWIFIAVSGLSLVAVCRFPFEVSCLVAEHELQSVGSVVVAHGLCCCKTCGIFPDQGSNPYPLHWQADS